MLPVIAITNASTVLTDDQVGAIIPALQHQVSFDFKAYWDLDATLEFVPSSEQLIEGWWQIVVVDNPDQAGALGYHEMTPGGCPLGKVFAKLDLDYGYHWTVTMSHELLEMLGDPWIDYAVQASDGSFYALEVSDPVEADSLGYEIDGVLVSDFVTPSWFEDTMADRLDFKQHLSKPLQIAPEGYISVFVNGSWSQLTGQRASESRVAPIGSRRDRRSVPRSLWKHSVK